MVLFFGLENTNRTYVPTSKALNMLHGTLFVVFVVNTLFMLFSGILTCNSISCAYLLAVYTVNIPSTAYCLFLTAANVLIEHLVLFFGLENTNRTFVPTFKALNMLDGTFFVVCLLVNTLFVLFWGILTLNCISRKYLVALYTVNTSR